MSTLPEHHRHHHHHHHHHHRHPYHHHRHYLLLFLTGHQISCIISTFDHVLFCAFILWNLTHIIPTFFLYLGHFCTCFITDKDY